MNNEKLKQANDMSSEISDLEVAINKISEYKGRGNVIDIVSGGMYRASITDKDTKDLIEEFALFRLTQKLNKLKEEFENL